MSDPEDPDDRFAPLSWYDVAPFRAAGQRAAEVGDRVVPNPREIQPRPRMRLEWETTPLELRCTIDLPRELLVSIIGPRLRALLPPAEAVPPPGGARWRTQVIRCAFPDGRGGRVVLDIELRVPTFEFVGTADC